MTSYNIFADSSSGTSLTTIFDPINCCRNLVIPGILLGGLHYTNSLVAPMEEQHTNPLPRPVIHGSYISRAQHDTKVAAIAALSATATPVSSDPVPSAFPLLPPSPIRPTLPQPLTTWPPPAPWALLRYLPPTAPLILLA